MVTAKKYAFLLCLAFLAIGPAVVRAMKPDIKTQAEPLAPTQRVFNYASPFEGARLNHLQKLEAKPWGAVVKKYLKEMDKKEAALWKEFFELTGLRLSQVHELLRDHEKEYIEQDGNEVATLEKIYVYTIPDSFKVAVADLCEVFGVNPQSIKLLYNPEQETSLQVSRASIQAASDILSFYDPKIYEHETEKLFGNVPSLRFTDGEIRFQLAHELWHIVYQDRYLEWLAKNVFNTFIKNETDGISYKKLMIKFHHFVEWRADILAALEELSSVKEGIAWIDRLREHMQKNKISVNDPLHPDWLVRKAYFRVLEEEMKDAILARARSFK